MFFLYNYLPLFILMLLSQVSFAGESGLLPMQVLNLSSDQRISTNALLADKNKRQLSLIDFNSLSAGVSKAQYSIDIGKKTGDKKKRDDRRTPEGIYILQKKMTQPEIPYETYGALAFTTNYPNFFDKTDSKTGSGIWLHSVPDSVPLTRGSRGCVVLRNNDIKTLDPFILLNKTFMIIDSQINWSNTDEHTREKNVALKWLEDWRQHWQTQDLDKYIENYSEEFSAPPFNRKSWLQHKQKLKERYSFVKIESSDPNIFQVKKQYLFQFVQNYESDGHKDTGIKTLYVIKEGGQMKIAREEWSEIK